jgi:hypothetical protein
LPALEVDQPELPRRLIVDHEPSAAGVEGSHLAE